MCSGDYRFLQQWARGVLLLICKTDALHAARPP
jgi:hypothetical protein